MSWGTQARMARGSGAGVQQGLGCQHIWGCCADLGTGHACLMHVWGDNVDSTDSQARLQGQLGVAPGACGGGTGTGNTTGSSGWCHCAQNGMGTCVTGHGDIVHSWGVHTLFVTVRAVSCRPPLLSWPPGGWRHMGGTTGMDVRTGKCVHNWAGVQVKGTCTQGLGHMGVNSPSFPKVLGMQEHVPHP